MPCHGPSIGERGTSGVPDRPGAVSLLPVVYPLAFGAADGHLIFLYQSGEALLIEAT